MPQEIKRVTKYVVEFVERSLRENKEFTARDLRLYVSLQLKGELASAPASADRIMRDQRKKGNINYELVSRRKSLYRALPVEPKTEYKATEYKAEVPVVDTFTGLPARTAAFVNGTFDFNKIGYVTYYGSDSTVRYADNINLPISITGEVPKKKSFWSFWTGR